MNLMSRFNSSLRRFCGRINGTASLHFNDHLTIFADGNSVGTSHAASAFVSLPSSFYYAETSRRDETDFVPKSILGSDIESRFHQEDDGRIPKTSNHSAMP